MSYPINNFFTRSFTHSDVTVTGSAAEALAALAQPGRRIHLLIQNQHATDVVEVILNSSGSEGFNLAPGATFSIEGYNGAVRLKSSGTSTPVHIAYAVA